MNVMNTSGDDLPECPLCMEPLEVDDLSFYPCTCGYQICRFCWHRIRTDENELCPACRKAYPENPADFKPLTQEQISALKAEKRQRDQQRKQKITENRKHLANVRVVQKNLVFVVGLPPRLADAEILKKHEYFGKYGKIHKVVINPSTTYAGVQGPSASAYVTYVHNNDALRAIQSVNNITIDGRSIKTSLGTTKYCSHFMKNQVCPKPDCMYLHELGDTEASFTKEEMHQGKHQEYEKRLHDSLIAQMQQQSQQPSTNPTSTSPTTTSPVSNPSESVSSSPSAKLGADAKEKDPATNGTSDAWPSLSTSPVTIKESKTNGKSGSKENAKNEANRKHEKVKGDKTKGKTLKQTAREKVKAQTLKSNNNINNNLEDELGETDDTDDTPSISSMTDSGTISESDSGKSSPPSSFPDPVHPGHHISQANNIINVTASTTATSSLSHEPIAKHPQQNEQQNKSIISTSSNSIIESSDITSLYTNSEKAKDGGLADTSARLSKLGLFDDNSSFFSRGFNSFSKLDGSSEHIQAMNNAQLPDLLNGTVNNNNMNLDLDSKQLLKNLGTFGSMSSHGENTHDDWESAFKYLMKNNNNNISKHYEQEQQQQEDWLRLQEQKKHQGGSSGLGANQFNNMFNNDNNVDNMFAHNEINRMMFNQQYSQQQQQRMNHNGDMNHVHPSMSKFFDFHKNQQQQQQNQFMMNSNPLTDQLNQLNLLDSHQRMNHNGSGFMDQSQRQRLVNKYDSSSNAPFNTSNTQNRMHNPSQYSNQSVEDDLGFDPFKETQKALAELINDEATQQQQQQQQMNGSGGQRSRMAPPPGFNHIQNNSFNSFGAASPRSQSGSKFPFVNMQQTQNNWPGMHMGFNQNSNEGGFPPHQNNMPQPPQQHKSSGFGNSFSDWSSLSIDPAIVSFRQFPQFNPQQQQQQQQQQAQNQDLYMSQINQQGFGMNHGMNMQNNLQSQTSPAGGVFSHQNVLNSMHYNGMGNFNNFDKFGMSSIPPPGFQPGNSNGKKTECIN